MDGSAYLPFGGRARNVPGLVPEGAITTAASAVRADLPYALTEQGAQGGDRQPALAGGGEGDGAGDGALRQSDLTGQAQIGRAKAHGAAKAAVQEGRERREPDEAEIGEVDVERRFRVIPQPACAQRGVLGVGARDEAGLDPDHQAGMGERIALRPRLAHHQGGKRLGAQRPA